MHSVTVVGLSLLYKSGVSGRSWIPRTLATLSLLMIGLNFARLQQNFRIRRKRKPSGVNLTFISSCIIDTIAEYNHEDAKFYNSFISVRRSTCFRLFFRPSSGAENCTYNVRHLLARNSSIPARLAAGSSIGLTNT